MSGKMPAYITRRQDALLDALRGNGRMTARALGDVTGLLASAVSGGLGGPLVRGEVERRGIGGPVGPYEYRLLALQVDETVADSERSKE